MSTSGTTTRRRAVRPGLVLFALAFSGISASFMQTLVIPIQSQLPELLGAPLSTTSWAITITQLVSAVSMPISGRLGDMYGKRRVALTLLLVLVAGSVLAALATNVTTLIIARGLQGAGFGIVVIGISILRDVMPAKRLGTSIAVVSATLGVGGAVGMPLSAAVAQRLDWHALFWVAALLSALAFLLVLTVVPPSALRSGGRLDVPGIIGLAIGLSATFLLISHGGSWGLAQTLGVGIGAAAILLVWGWHELRTSNPLVELRISARAPVLMTNITGIAMGFALFTPQVAFPQMLGLPAEFGGLGMSLVAASLVVMSSGLAMLVMSPVAGWFGQRWGSKSMVVIGAVLMAVGYAIALIAEPSIVALLLACIIIGSGTGLGYAAMPALIMGAVPVNETGAANGLNALARSLGTTLAAALVATLLANSAITISGTSAPSTNGFDLVFVIAIGASLICAILAAFIPKPRSQDTQEDTELLAAGDPNESATASSH